MKLSRTSSSYPLLALLLVVGASHCSGTNSPDAEVIDSMVQSDATNDIPTVGMDTPNPMDVANPTDTPNPSMDNPNPGDSATVSDVPNALDTGVPSNRDVVVSDTYSDANASDGAQPCVQMGGVCQMYSLNMKNRSYTVFCPAGRVLPNGQPSHTIRTPAEAMSTGCPMAMGDGATIAAYACCR